MGLEWYFVRCQSGREDSIRKQLENRINVAGVQDVVPQILVPFERVTVLKGGDRKIVNRKLYPGYLMVQADISEDDSPRVAKARSVLKETRGFGDFLGSGGEASPLSETEVTSILSRMADSESRPQVKINMSKGDMVRIKSGAFDGFDGAIEDINPDKGTVRVVVTIFGRPTPVELEYWEVETV
ncbi:MAG: transcriptional antiterminator NusG [Planctomycetota bacterium]|jgi:transcriptional antiterminator NusG